MSRYVEQKKREAIQTRREKITDPAERARLRERLLIGSEKVNIWRRNALFDDGKYVVYEIEYLTGDLANREHNLYALEGPKNIWHLLGNDDTGIFLFLRTSGSFGRVRGFERCRLREGRFEPM